MDFGKIAHYISNWLSTYCNEATMEGFVVGISGGIDSAVTSTLCAITGKETLVLSMPIRQGAHEHERADKHIAWLKAKFPNVRTETVDLTGAFEKLEEILPKNVQDFLTMANTRSRLRMLTLYAFASRHKLLVAGTGNKVEDFGVGFYTKYGDGGVDLSPIADLFKTEVYDLGKSLGIIPEILRAPPTDGLYADGRTDEDQIGATYPELEWAMTYTDNKNSFPVTERQKHVLEIYNARHRANLHKMVPIPVCTIPEDLKTE
jgi:NAD+ synthase